MSQQAQNVQSAEENFLQSSQSEEEHIMAVRSGRNVILWCGINPYRTGNAPIAADFCCRKTAEVLKFIAITKSVAGQANKLALIWQNGDVGYRNSKSYRCRSCRM